MTKSNVLSTASIFFGFIGFVFILVALCTDNWLQGSSSNNGLWRTCEGDVCQNLLIGRNMFFRNYEMVRGFGVLACVLTLLGTVVTVVNLIIKKNIGFSVMATMFLMAAFFGLICTSLFTSLSSGAPSSWGYSYGLGWASFPMTLIAGVIMAYMELKSV